MSSDLLFKIYSKARTIKYNYKPPRKHYHLFG